jgi:hypothetical protein
MKKITILAALIAAFALATLPGCVAAIGNREPPRSSATLGQQLIDLQKAKDAGVISDLEFQHQRAKYLADK